MSLTDVKIALIFVLVFAAVIFTSTIFGLKGTYFVLCLSSFMNGCFLISSLMANGKL